MGKNKITVYLDFDSTLVNSSEVLIQLLNEKFNTNKNYRDIKRYDCKDLFPNVTSKEILNIFDSSEFFNKIKFFPNAIDVLLKYNSVFNYEVVTIGLNTNLFLKEKWLKNNFHCNFKFVGIENTKMDKGIIDMSDGIIIDDHIDNIRSSNAKYKILYKDGLNTEWNTQNCHIDKLIEVDNWNEIDYLFTHLIRKDN